MGEGKFVIVDARGYDPPDVIGLFDGKEEARRHVREHMLVGHGQMADISIRPIVAPKERQ